MSKKGFCLICFKDLRNQTSLTSFFKPFPLICNKCKKEFKILNHFEIFNNVEVLFLYEYEGVIKSLIYKYKGCYDYELKDVFLYEFVDKLKKLYKGYTIIFPPSSNKDDKERGYKHIKEMCKCLNLKIEDLFFKSIEYKQSEHLYKDRKNISKIIKVKNDVIITNKKYLIVDDIFTSGSTLKAIIDLLLKNKVSKSNIKALIICKTNCKSN